MRHSDFIVGKSFWCGGREWRCTDVGTRTIVAICLDDNEVVRVSPGPPRTETLRTLTRSEAAAEGWFNGPPYALAESVFDEYDQQPCAFDADRNGEGNGETPVVTGVKGPFTEALKTLRARRDAARALKAESADNDIATDQV
jgi:hypothetical protein